MHARPNSRPPLGGTPSFKGYNGFPASICVSLNEEVVHGIPGPRRLAEGDLVSLDFGAIYDGYHADAALTVPIGRISPEAERLMQVTREALELGIAAARRGQPPLRHRSRGSGSCRGRRLLRRPGAGRARDRPADARGAPGAELRGGVHRLQSPVARRYDPGHRAHGQRRCVCTFAPSRTGGRWSPRIVRSRLISSTRSPSPTVSPRLLPACEAGAQRGCDGEPYRRVPSRPDRDGVSAGREAGGRFVVIGLDGSSSLPG